MKIHELDIGFPIGVHQFKLGEVGAFLGMSVLNNVSNNIMNARNTDKVNASNEYMLHQQMQYQTGEREAMQEYNTPAAQRGRFEDAGINPYLAMSNITSGETSAQTSPSASPMQKADWSSPFSGAADAMLQGIDMLGLDEKYKGIALDNQAKAFNNMYLLQDKILDIDSKIEALSRSSSEREKNAATIKHLNTQRKFLQLQSDFFADTQSWQKRAIKADAIQKELQNEYQSLVNDAYPSLTDLQKRSMSASIASQFAQSKLFNSQSNLTDEQAKTEIRKCIGQSILNEINRGNITLQELGMNQAQLDALRAGRKLEEIGNDVNNRSPLMMILDNSFEFLNDWNPIKFTGK